MHEPDNHFNYRIIAAAWQSILIISFFLAVIFHKEYPGLTQTNPNGHSINLVTFCIIFGLTFTLLVGHAYLKGFRTLLAPPETPFTLPPRTVAIFVVPMIAINVYLCFFSDEGSIWLLPYLMFVAAGALTLGWNKYHWLSRSNPPLIADDITVTNRYRVRAALWFGGCAFLMAWPLNFAISSQSFIGILAAYLGFVDGYRIAYFTWSALSILRSMMIGFVNAIFIIIIFCLLSPAGGAIYVHASLPHILSGAIDSFSTFILFSAASIAIGGIVFGTASAVVAVIYLAINRFALHAG
jgi:hypothetical protein